MPKPINPPAISFELELTLNTSWLLFAGIVLILEGAVILLSIYLPTFIMSESLALAYIIVAIISLIHSFRFWFRKIPGFILHIIASILYFLIGIFCIANLWFNLYFYIPIVLMIVIATFIVMGIFSIYIAIIERLQCGWLWTLYSGLINLFLIPVILLYMYQFPFMLLVIVTGVDILATGIALLALGIAAKYQKHCTRYFSPSK